MAQPHPFPDLEEQSQKRTRGSEPNLSEGIEDASLYLAYRLSSKFQRLVVTTVRWNWKLYCPQSSLPRC